ncbi:transmembrane protein 132C-like [Ylistrum balloti]|uniref:transmembrane protein 132C-like n=1 Tax=Ylistrum balloti TaxID=509963 RepID=UPI002905D0FD|nr:transmembrane protein 132C-like [Ylistrum balloti]
MKMPWRDRIGAIFLLGLLHGLVESVEIEFDSPVDGFFLKSVYHKNEPWDPLMKKENFVITRPAENYNLKASSGPFEVHQVIQDDLVHTLLDSNTMGKPSLVDHDVVFNLDVSAHIISDTLSPKWPKLQVLIHASPPLSSKSRGKGKVKSSSSKAGYRGTPRMWCGHVYAHLNNQELSSLCVLSNKDNACVASLIIPENWFHSDDITGVPSMYVSYTFSHADQNQECASASNSIVPGRSFENSLTNKRKYIMSLSLANRDNEYEVKKDQHILIHVPKESFTPSSVFEIPVKLEARSDLQVFVMRAKVRNGLKITGAIAEADGPWQIHVDINERQRVGTVTARIHDITKYMASTKVQEIFKWRVEVEETGSNIGTGRIIWSIEYERDQQHESYTSQGSRIVSRINIRSREQERIVPILKVREILNFALLTERKQVYPLRVYSVKESDDLTDISEETACHSAEEDVLKVTSNCSSVYVDGTERRGSHNVTIIAKSGRNTAFVNVRVWIPAEHLDVQLSDEKLSQVRGWKVSQRHQGRGNRRGRTRNKRLVDQFPMLKKYRKYSRGGGGGGGGSCQLRHQQAIVEVYAQFYISTPGGPNFFKSKKAWLRVTDMVMDKLRVTDPRVVSLNNGVIQGQSVGRTEVQVMTPMRRLIGGKEVRVSNDKVSVDRLVITLVSGITLGIHISHEIPGALTAISHIQDRLYNKYQEAVLDVSIQYSDGTHFPLAKVEEEDYILDVSTLNHYVIGMAPYTNQYQPRIVALGQGHGELLKVMLKLSNDCARKRSRSVSVNYVVVDSDFSPGGRVYNDPFVSGGIYTDNRASGHSRDSKNMNINNKKLPYISHPIIEKDQGKDDKDRKMFPKKDQKDLSVIPVEFDLAENLRSQESPQTKQEPVRQEEIAMLSPLEIGMYVLLAVFCVAICVFLVNCIVFMVRYKRKHVPKGKRLETVAQANDWVWIGRATLERNAINTKCSQTLMPAEDFNGNHTPVAGGSSQNSSGQNSAEASNRSSFVSTIKGSECSIRITANPLLEASNPPSTVGEELDNNNQRRQLQQHIDPEWDYEAMGMTYDQLVDYFDNLKESTA